MTGANTETSTVSYSHSLAFSPDSKTLAVGQGGEKLLLWNIGSGTRTEFGVTQGYRGPNVLAYSSDGKTLVEGSRCNSEQVKRWDIATGKKIVALNGDGAEYVRAVRYSPVSRTLCVTYGGWGVFSETKLWNADTGKTMATFKEQHPYASAAYSPDGKMLAVARRTDTTEIWDAATGKMIRKIPGCLYPGPLPQYPPPGGGNVPRPTMLVDAVAFSGDGKWLVICHQFGYTELRDTTTWKPVRVLSQGYQDLDSFPEGSTLYTPSASWSVAISKDGKWLATGGDSEARLWDANLGKCVFSASVPEIQFVALSANGNTLAAGGQAWDLRKMKDQYQLLVAQGLWKDSSALTTTKRKKATWRPHDQPMALSGDGTLLVQPAFTRSGGTWSAMWLRTYLSLQEAVTAKSIRDIEFEVSRLFTGHRSIVNCLSLTSDSKSLFIGAGKTVKHWDLATGKEIRVFQGHTDNVLSLSISADSKHLATGSADGTAPLWDIESGKELRVFLPVLQDVSRDVV